jgi:phytoene synthase
MPVSPPLAPELRIALAQSPRVTRPALQALLVFDALLGQIVRRTSEPILGQMRLAWWRTELGKEAGERARGNEALTALGQTWYGEEEALIGLIDGWEELLGAPPLGAAAVDRFADGRARCFGALARRVGEESESAGHAGRRWALVDFAWHTTNASEREAALAAASLIEPVRLPRALRGLAVLDGLARRALARGEPIMAGRGGALAAIRLGILGR